MERGDEIVCQERPTCASGDSARDISSPPIHLLGPLFTIFFAFEQFLQWHHGHRAIAGIRPRPLTYLVLLDDGLHNLLGGLRIR